MHARKFLWTGYSLMVLFFFSGHPITWAQSKDLPTQWTLQQTIEYALQHNVSIQINEVNQRLAALNFKQSRLAQLPSLNMNPSYGVSKGRSINPTTNQFVEGSYQFVGAGANSDVLLFGWFQQRNVIAKNKLDLKAAAEDLEQLKNDVSLNIATGFLRVLMAREQIKINEQQVGLSAAQLLQTQKFAQAGRVPELNVAQLEAQLASDSALLIGALSDYNAALLDLKALMNLDFEQKFEAIVPDIPVEERITLQNLNPEYIYEQALAQLPNIKSSTLKLASARKSRDAAWGALWPQLRLGGQLGSNWTSNYRQISGYSGSTDLPTGAYVNVGGTKLDVFQNYNVPIIFTPSLGTQLQNNFRQTVSATLSFPIFNAWQAQYQVKQAKLNVISQELNLYQNELKLRQDVYKAYNDALNAVQKYNAAKRSKEAAKRAFDFAAKRYELGLTNTIEYLSIQNNLYKSEGSLLSNKYDLIFKLKVIDYYLGKRLSL